MRKALVAWERGARYDLPGFREFAAGGGCGREGFAESYKLEARMRSCATTWIDTCVLVPARPMCLRSAELPLCLLCLAPSGF